MPRYCPSWDVLRLQLVIDDVGSFEELNFEARRDTWPIL